MKSPAIHSSLSVFKEKKDERSMDQASLHDAAELCGILLGDGHISKSANRIFVTGSLEDKLYYERTVLPLFGRLFGLKPKMMKRSKVNSYFLQLENKAVFNFIVDDLGLKRGHKKTADIPKWIIDEGYSADFLRGLFDTDGSLKFSKQARQLNYYPRLQIALQNSPLVHTLATLLEQVGFNFGKWQDKRYQSFYYHVSGKSNLEKWMQLVGMNNPVHKTKYLIWKTRGIGLPKSTLTERFKILESQNISVNSPVV